MFKATIVLCGLFFAAFAFLIQQAMSIEISAYESKSIVEYEIKKEVDIRNLKCDFEMKEYEACKSAIDKITISDSFVSLFETTSLILIILIAITFLASLIRFLLHPFMHSKK